ncbi:MAG: amidohydrolase family protein [Rubrivivax sp.]|nr:amidohydrolase family protein [Rubrivivax sp.]MDP3611613.1 amidohydrolase family protein [Rubrivivax sp.]
MTRISHDAELSAWPASLPVVDCHHHLWDLQANHYPWLTDRVTQRVCGDYAAIRKNYLLEDFRRDAADVNLVQSVHVEAVADPSDPAKETRWLRSIADSTGSGGFPHGIVAYCDLGRADVGEVLAAHGRCANLRGIRQMLHETRIDSANRQPSLFEDPVWQRNFQLLKHHGLSFEMQVYPEQMAGAARLVQAFPATQFILCHTGQPREQTPSALHGWRNGLRGLALHANVALKISGLGMFDRQWTIDSLRPIVRDAVDIFGEHRCMFASNFPVDGMMSSYGRLWRAYLSIVADFAPEHQRALFAGNAQRIYRLPPLPAMQTQRQPSITS